MNSKPLFRQSRVELLESRIAPAAISVINTNNSGAGSLRQALATADTDLLAHPGVVNTITFKLPAPAAHSENTITLTGGALTSKGDVNIIGPGAGKLIISGASLSGVFDFTNGATNSPVSISGISIVDGHASQGAGITSMESLTLKNVVVSGNVATTRAGAIYVHGMSSKVAISNSLISVNSGASGSGGIGLYALDSFTLTNTIVTGNTSGTAGHAGLAANVYGAGVQASITGCQFIGNVGTFGAGFEIIASSSKTPNVLVKNTVISGNNSTSFSGGGAYFRDGNIQISGTKVLANTSVDSGAGLFFGLNTAVTISSSTISGNVTTSANAAGKGGGGIGIEGVGAATPIPVKITSSTFSGNRTNSDGGGLWITNGIDLSITGSTFTGNSAVNPSTDVNKPDSHGGGLAVGGIDNAQVNVSITSSKFTNNVADNGGGISTDLGDNTPGAGAFSMTSCILTGNTSINGGALRLNSTGKATLTNNTVTNNIGTRYGGGLSLNDNSNITITGGLISGNLSNRGPGIEFFNAVGTVTKATITGNVTQSASFGAGGVYAQSYSAVTLHADTISGNNAADGYDVSHDSGSTITFA